MARRGAGERLKRGEGWKLGRLVFSLERGEGVHGGRLGPPGVSHALVEVRLQLLLLLCVMPQPLDQARPLRRRYSVHVAGQLGHALLKACTLDGEERRKTGLWVVKAHHRSVGLRLTIRRVCNKVEKGTRMRDVTGV